MKKRIALMILNAGLCGAIAISPIAAGSTAASGNVSVTGDKSDAESGLNNILPQTMTEFTQFTEEYGIVSVHGKYIVYCDTINYSTGSDVIMEQLGTAEIKEMKHYDVKPDTPINPGDPSHTVIVYEAVTKGTVKVTISQGRTWDPDNSKTEKSVNYFSVNDDMSVIELNEEEYEAIISGSVGFKYEIKDGSIIFENTSNHSVISYIISSNLDYEMDCRDSREKSTFTPKENGRYVLTVNEMYENIVGTGSGENSGHFHYFYPVLTNYTVDVSGNEITFTKQGSRNYYSEEQINKILEEAENSDYPLLCDYVTTDGADDLLGGVYFSFVNGQMPLAESGDFKSYITTCYNEYSTQSYFCINTDKEVSIFNDSVAEIQEKLNTSSYVDGDLGLGTCDIMDFYKIKALKDGKLTVTAGSDKYHNLEIKNGIFRRLSDIKGDANGDKKISISDAVMLQKWILGSGELTCWKNTDLNNDNQVDIFDLCLLKKQLTINPPASAPVMTKNDFMKIIASKSEYTWSDFDKYKSENIDSDLYILKYEIDMGENEGSCFLYIGGESMDEKPQYMEIEFPDGKRMDIYDLVKITAFNVPENNTENQTNARKIGEFALSQLKDGKFTSETEINSSNAEELLDNELVEAWNESRCDYLKFIDEHTIMIENYSFMVVYGYFYTDGTVKYQPGDEVSVPGFGLDGDIARIEWADGNLCYFSAST